MAESPSWSRALTLSERDFLFPPDAEPGSFDPAKAEQRLERWRRETGLEAESLFSLRLEQQRLSPGRFARLLGADPPEPDGELAWLAWIERAFSAA
ncbi:MAG: hypothetical protein AAGM22_33195, partial [Acidobacteriota bacterium]